MIELWNTLGTGWPDAVEGGLVIVCQAVTDGSPERFFSLRVLHHARHGFAGRIN
jgi:hypothetical protein